MGLFKYAAARGVAHELVRQGVVQFPSKQAMDEAADQAADSMPAMPELPPAGAEAPPAAGDTQALAAKIIELAEQLMASGGPGGRPMPPGPAEELGKAAAAADLETVASEAAIACMDKAAAETGTLAGQGKSTNTPEEAAKTDPVAALDQKQRPQGEHVVGQGNTKMDLADKGRIGASTSPTVQPNASPSGENSVTKGTKSAAELRSLIKQADKLVGLGGGGNTMSDSVDPLAKLDLKHRPLGKYMVGAGGANFSEEQAARVGLEKKPDVKPTNSPSGTNSVTEASKAAELDEEKAYLILFQKTASDVREYLPSELSEDEKIAAVSAMIGLDTPGRQAYLNDLHSKVAAAKKTQPSTPTTGDEAPATGGLLAQVRQAVAGK